MTDQPLSPPVREVLEEIAGLDAVTRLHQRDTSLWGPDAQVRALAAERLGWLDSPTPPAAWPTALDSFAEACRRDGLERVVLCGMGGSGLAPLVFAQAVDPERVGARFTLLDSTHPEAVRGALGSGLDGAVVVVSSKSGTTIETRAMADYAAGRVAGPGQLVAITDPGSALDAAATEGGWRTVWRNPPDIGGRFSALSLFGMAPVAAVGLPVVRLWERARAAARRCGPDMPLERNPAALLAAFTAAHARAGRDKLTLLLPPRLASLGLWVEQLVAESTGKNGTGVVPVVGEPVGPPDVYGADRAFVEVCLGGTPVAGADALAQAGHPVLRLDLDTPFDVAGAMVEWMLATALVGALLGVEPFDQPDVASAKEATAAVIADIGAGGSLPETADGDLGAFAAGARPGDYLAVEAFLPPTREVADGLAVLQERLRAVTGCAVTAGLGPRYLHSTGQLHKGGPDRVLVVHLLDDAVGEDIPGWGYDFGTLIRAQAAGDLRVLRERGRRALQVRASAATLPALAARLPRQG